MFQEVTLMAENTKKYDLFKPQTEEEFEREEYEKEKELIHEVYKEPNQREKALKQLEEQYKPYLKITKLQEEIEIGIKKEFDIIQACETIIEHQPIFYDKSGNWWAWNKELLIWEIVDEIEIISGLKNSLKDINEILRNNIYSQFFRSLKVVSRCLNLKELNKEWLQFKNVIINYKTGETLKPSSEYFLTNSVPHNLGESEETPVINKLIKEWVGEEYTECVYDIFAYLLLREYPIQRIIVFLGSGSNGKGSFLRLMRGLLGINNCCSTDLDKLSQNRFETANLYNKLLCEIAETNITNLKHTSTLKRLTGGDLISAEFKGKNSFQFENYAKLIVASNSLPMTSDRTDGFYRRWLIIDFPNKFEDGKEITDEVSEEEYENLCLKLVKRLPGLLERGKFAGEGNVNARRNKYEEKSNPLKAFLDEFYEKDYAGSVPKWEFTEDFKQFLVQRGYRDLSNREVNTGLRSLGYDLNKKRIEEKDNPIWFIDGLKRKNTDPQKKVNEL